MIVQKALLKRIAQFFLITAWLNTYGMDKQEQALTGIGPQSILTDVPLPDITSMNHNHDINGSCIGNYNPSNTNTVYISMFGAMRSELSKLLDREKYQGIVFSITQAAGSTITWMLNNKKLSFASFAMTACLALNARLIYLSSKLKDQNSCWSLWRSNLRIEELYQMPRQILYNDLLTNIQTKYTNFSNFRDTMAPLARFLEDAEKEERLIKSYEDIARLIKLLHISNFTFYNHVLHKQLNQRSSKLLFLKCAFLNWYADRRLSTSERDTFIRRFPRARRLLNTISQVLSKDEVEENTLENKASI